MQRVEVAEQIQTWRGFLLASGEDRRGAISVIRSEAEPVRLSIRCRWFLQIIDAILREPWDAVFTDTVDPKATVFGFHVNLEFLNRSASASTKWAACNHGQQN